MEVKVYDKKGKGTGTLKLEESVFALPWNPSLVFQVSESEMSNRRSNTAKVKDRAEVRGGGKKPWAQKGTGRARHGSIRSPLWIGGGVTHGPTNDRNYLKKINKKARRKAILTIFSQKLREGEIIFFDSIEFPDGKTKNAAEFIKSVSRLEGLEQAARKSNILVLLLKTDRSTFRSLRNIPNVEVKEVRNVSSSDLLRNKFVFMPLGAEKELATGRKEEK